MGATAVLSDRRIAVAPGGEATCELKVRNAGDVVDQFELDVVGDAHGWTTIEPRIVNLLPGDEKTATVTFRPTRSSEVQAGEIPFGVRVASREDPYGSAVDEGVVEVEPFADVVAELVPTKRKGRRRARFRLAVDNNGNTGVDLGIVPSQEGDEAAIKVDPGVLTAQPGTATFVKVRVVPHKRFLRGSPQNHPFELSVRPEDPPDTEAEPSEPVTAEGVMIQEQLLPKGVLLALALAIVALGALVALWFALLKPTVQSAAREQAQEEVQEASEAAQRANDAANEAEEVVDQATDEPTEEPTDAGEEAPSDDQTGQHGEGGENGGEDGGENGPDGSDEQSSGIGPTIVRIQTAADRVSDDSFQTFGTTPSEKLAFEISDLVLQNPRGDVGFLRVVLGDDILLEVGLANFRDLDYHYVIPLRLDADEELSLRVNCTSPGPGSRQCTPSASFSGRLAEG